MALRFEPSRFFLKGKVTQKQTSYIHKYTVREKVSQVFISHLTNFLSYSVFMFVACLFLCHFAFEKEVRNVRSLTFILHLYYRSFRLVSSLQQLILYLFFTLRFLVWFQHQSVLFVSHSFGGSLILHRLVVNFLIRKKILDVSWLRWIRLYLRHLYRCTL